jgi:hypothetical protein
MRKKLLIKKFIISFLIIFLFLPFFIRPTLAYQGTTGAGYQFEFEEAISSEEMNLQSFVNETLKAIMGSFVHFIIGPLGTGCSPETPDNCLTQGEGQFLGLIPVTSLIIANLYSSPPASGINYFADLGKKIGIVHPVLAEENTFNSFTAMKMLQPIWTTFRNISYLLFVLILIGMGFAIMFRVKISPQAVITIQSALPRIILALLLITFSYAIVGFILDISLFLNSVIADVFKAAINLNGNSGWVFTIYEKFVAIFTPEEAHNLVRPFADAFIYGQLGATLMFIVILATSWLVIPIIVGLIIAILLAIAYLRALWTLLKAFAMIIVNLVFAPLRILVGVFPGSNGITNWFKDVIANAAVLPTMLTIFFLGNYLIIMGITEMAVLSIKKSAIEGFGIYGGFWFLSAFLFPLIGIFILLMIPKVSDMIQSAITKKPFQYGTAIGETVSAPGRGIAQGVRVFNVGLETATRWNQRPKWLRRSSVPSTRLNEDGEIPKKPLTPGSQHNT